MRMLQFAPPRMDLPFFRICPFPSFVRPIPPVLFECFYEFSLVDEVSGISLVG